MVKLKSPLLGLGAHGTLADSITFVKRAKGTVAEKKPIPAYRRTLPQQYQRWLYQDYAYWWTQQTAAIKQTWQTAASRHHMTGFAYWMSYHLANLPDILAWYKLDNVIGLTAYDSSPFGTDRPIIGASPVTAIIDQGLYFDGLNDRIDLGDPPQLNYALGLSIDCFFKNPLGAGGKVIASKYDSTVPLRSWQLADVYFRMVEDPHPWDGGYSANSALGAIVDGYWHHILGAWETGQKSKIYIDGILQGTAVKACVDLPVIAVNVYVAFLEGAFQEVSVDNLVFYNRMLDAADAKRHSERGYP